MEEIKKYFEGCILGLAIGDALGFPVEFMNRSEITANFGEDGVLDFERGHGFEKGTYSDDTQMSIAVAKALINADVTNLDNIMLHIKNFFIEWADSKENNRAPGQSCMDGIRFMKEGVHWFSSGDAYSKGCGAAMRAAPIGLIFSKNQKDLIDISRAVSICTHAHPTGLSSAITVSAAVAYVLRKEPLDNMIPYLCDLLQQKRGHITFTEIVNYDPLDEQVKLLKLIPQHLNTDPKYAFDIFGGGWIGEEAAAGAIYSFLRSPDDFKTTVTVAANACRTNEKESGFGRCDSDSIASIAGAISGAYNGINKIPKNWIDNVENRDFLLKLSSNLYEKSLEA